MFRNYIITAIRQIARNKASSVVSIIGLAIGLAVFVFANLIAQYERNYDKFFPGYESIYAVYSELNPAAGIGMQVAPGTFPAIGPLLRAELRDRAVVGQVIKRDYLTRHGDTKFYQEYRFADPEVLDIFELDFISGDAATALAAPGSVILSADTAKKYFGGEGAVGKTLTINNVHDLNVTGVFAELPVNSHLTSNLIENASLEMIAGIAELERIAGFDPAGNWDSLSIGDYAYIRAGGDLSRNQIDEALARIFAERTPEEAKQFLAGFHTETLARLNLAPWEMTGLPALTTIQILGALVLIVAGLNYANLATAQVMSRMMEVGMRRALGASRRQLFAQFLVESITLATGALILALAAIELVLPYFNDAVGRSISLNLFSDPTQLVKLVLTAALAGIIAGGYPAYLISQGRTTEMLDKTAEGGGRTWLRSLMLVVQFSISIFMMIAVAVVYFQNRKIEQSSQIFAKDRIVTLGHLGRPEITAKYDTLRNELLAIPGVENVARSSLVPFEQSHSAGKYSKQSGDEANLVDISPISVDWDFFATYEIPVIAGRDFSRDYANDTLHEDENNKPTQDWVNVVINELAARQLGWQNPADAIGQSIYQRNDSISGLEARIVGVVPDINFQGFHNEQKPFVFMNRLVNLGRASVRIDGAATADTLSLIDAAWDRVVADYPIDRRFLDDYFDDVFGVFRSINNTIAGFALIAFLLASVGLFGLSAVMATKRTREIGIRKVLGAGVSDIVRLLTWQFSRPVVVAVALASPLAYLAASYYLEFFSDRIALTPVLFVLTGAIALGFAWGTVSYHAIRVARANPIHALRYE